MNTIVLMGRLARNPETKLASTQKGQIKVSRFPLVVVSTGSKKKSQFWSSVDLTGNQTIR